MDKIINNFRGDYFFLSNFYIAPVTYADITYTSNEAAFQAQKLADPERRIEFGGLNPSEAKKLGRHVPLRPDWEEVKIGIMYQIVTAKFMQNPALRLRLQATGSAQLEEGNTWGDTFWGRVNGIGQNHLGKILMQVRSELHKNKELIILERENGWYGGYEVGDTGIKQLFNTTAHSLFDSMKWYTNQGYSVTCLDGFCKKQLMEGRRTIDDVLDDIKEDWKEEWLEVLKNE